MIIKLRSQLHLGLLALFLLWLQFPFPQCEARQLKDDRIVFPGEAKTKSMETPKTNPVPIRNETKQQEVGVQRKPSESKNETIKESTEQSTKDALENSTEQFRIATSESSLVTTESKKMMPTKVEFGPRITLDSLPVCGEGLKLSGNHCRKEA
ncbi:hypothetical protein ACLKA7_013565 [Drosophila subpalustris]